MGSPFFAGVDVGGTNIKVGLVNVDGEVVAYDKFPTQPNVSPSSNLKNASDLIRRLIVENGMTDGEFIATGLATPGPMDIPSGKILTPFNLPAWRHQNVRDMLAEFVERPVAFSNDAGAAAYGEYWIGSGREYNSAILITLGTGVGGGIIIDGQSVDGAHSHGAEIGHLNVNSAADARKCSCGLTGCLEAYASATALVAITAERIAAGESSSLKDLIGDDSPLSTLMIYKAAQDGDSLATKMIGDTARWLGIGIASLAHVIDPEVVLLGGAMNFGGNDSQIGREFLAAIYTNFRSRSLPVVAEKLVVKFASLGSDAGFIGAAGLAKSHFFDKAVPA